MNNSRRVTVLRRRKRFAEGGSEVPLDLDCETGVELSSSISELKRINAPTLFVGIENAKDKKYQSSR